MFYLSINKYKKQSGFSLLEVLISLLIIAIGLIGLGGLQVASLKGATNAHSRTIATMYATELADRMRANPQGVQGGFYDDPVTCSGTPACRRTTYCSPQDIAKFDVREVTCGMKRASKREGGVKKALIKGTLEVTCDGDCGAARAIHNITITWGETKFHKKQTADILDQSLTVPVIP